MHRPTRCVGSAYTHIKAGVNVTVCVPVVTCVGVSVVVLLVFVVVVFICLHTYPK